MHSMESQRHITELNIQSGSLTQSPDTTKKDMEAFVGESDNNGRTVNCLVASTTSDYLPHVPTGGDFIILPWPVEVKNVNDERSEEWVRILRLVEVYEKNRNPTGVDEFIILLQNLLPTGENSLFRHNASFGNLRSALEYCQCKKDVFIKTVVPWMIRVLRSGPKVFESQSGSSSPYLPILRQGRDIDQEVTLTHPQCCVILVCSFFSIFPNRHHHSYNYCQQCDKRNKLPYVNCISLFNATYGKHNGKSDSPIIEKIVCLISTFTYLQEESAKKETRDDQSGKTSETSAFSTTLFPFPDHVIQFVRCVKSIKQLEDIRKEADTRRLSPLSLRRNQLIEDIYGAIQVDFANKELGGGVIHRGCAQEEIRFIVCVDMIVSRIICEPLLSNEAVLLNGCRKYINYSGYGHTFKFKSLVESTETDVCFIHNSAHKIIVRSCVVAIDATDFSRVTPETQYQSVMIERELNKAIVGFHGSSLSWLADGRPLSASPSNICHSVVGSPIATGHWGCGCFHGDKVLKFLIQWIAASICARPMVYCTLGDAGITIECATVVGMEMNAGELYDILMVAAKRYREIKENKARDFHNSCASGQGSDSETFFEVFKAIYCT